MTKCYFLLEIFIYSDCIEQLPILTLSTPWALSSLTPSLPLLPLLLSILPSFTMAPILVLPSLSIQAFAVLLHS
jgi:hypothetical protein